VPGAALPLADEVPFASARKWSAVAFDSPELRGAFALGAIEMLRPALPAAALAPDGPLLAQARAWSDQGLRVLLFAGNTEVTSLHGPDGEPLLPSLEPIALVCLRDELRPQVDETLAAFRQLGIEIKVISGDNPQTVAALARQAGFPAGIRLVSGPELAAMSEAELSQSAAEATIFGRITPAQKDQLVHALMRQGKRVAMMGDGVNDVPALKQASLGIAMESGSTAARQVADMLLLGDSFAALRPAFQEGRRIIGGMTNALYLSLSRVATTTLIIIGVTMVGLGFPFDPAQTGLTTFTIGLPSLLLTLWARPVEPERRLARRIVGFVIPVALLTMLLGLAVYIVDYQFLLTSPLTQQASGRAQELFEGYTGVPFGDVDYATTVATVLAQGSLSIFISWTACLLILFLEPPTRFFLGWRSTVSPDKRPAWLALALFAGLMVVWLNDTVGYYFGILEKPLQITLLILGVVVVWFFAVRAIWRWRLFDRLLGDEADGSGADPGSRP
ncbi:MAG TPA: HAD-IC family P-type ATPase, partial [Herpetosiphonaceae bacterium]